MLDEQVATLAPKIGVKLASQAFSVNPRSSRHRRQRDEDRLPERTPIAAHLLPALVSPLPLRPGPDAALYRAPHLRRRRLRRVTAPVLASRRGGRRGHAGGRPGDGRAQDRFGDHYR